MITTTWLQVTPAYVVAFIILVLLVACYWLGYQYQLFHSKRNPGTERADLTAISGLLLGMLGLLLAFSFSMANSRFDRRREVVIEEANNIGTAILRTDVYPDSMRQLLRLGFREYVEARISFYQAGMDLDKVVMYSLKADSISGELWKAVAHYAHVDNVTTRTSEMIPALNAMIDITTSRWAAGVASIPDSIMYFLFGLCIASFFLLGYDSKGKPNWIVITGFALLLSSTVFTIMDLDKPRSGLISLDGPNQKIVELRGLFKN